MHGSHSRRGGRSAFLQIWVKIALLGKQPRYVVKALRLSLCTARRTRVTDLLGGKNVLKGAFTQDVLLHGEWLSFNY